MNVTRLMSIWVLAVPSLVVLASRADAQTPPTLPTPASEYQMGVGAGGVFTAVAARNNTIYAATDVAGVFRSADAGVTWKPANSITTGTQFGGPTDGLTSGWVTDLFWHPRLQSRIIAASADGLFYADDSGGSTVPQWHRALIQEPPPGVTYPEGIPPGANVAGGSWGECRNTLGRGDVQSSSSAIAAYVDPAPSGPVKLYAVSGLSWYQKAVYEATHRDLLYESTDNGASWSVYRIRLNTDGQCCPNYGVNTTTGVCCTAAGPECAVTDQWIRAFTDVEVFDNRVWVAGLDGHGVFSTPLPLSTTPVWSQENAGLFYGCGAGNIKGYHPISFQKFDPDGAGSNPENLYVTVSSAYDPDAGGKCSADPNNGTPTIKDWGVYRRGPGATSWTSSTCASPAGTFPRCTAGTGVLPVTYNTPSTLRTYNTLAKRLTKLFVAGPANAGSNNGFLYQSSDGKNWFPVSAMWRAPINATTFDPACANRYYTQLGLDFGPFEEGRNGYTCNVGGYATGFFDWYPNPEHKLKTGDTWSNGVYLTDAKLYDAAAGVHRIIETLIPTIPTNPASYAKYSGINPLWVSLTTRAASGACDVSNLRDWNDNFRKCWQDAKVGLPDISAVLDAKQFENYIWIPRLDWSGSMWRYDIVDSRWEEFQAPLPYTGPRRVSDQNRNTDPKVGYELFSIATRAGTTGGTASCASSAQHPMILMGGGEISYPAHQGGILIKMQECVSATSTDDWPAEGIKGVGLVTSGVKTNQCPVYVEDDSWQPCYGQVSDLAWLPPQTNDGTGGKGRFFMAIAGKGLNDTDADGTLDTLQGKIGIYTSLEGETWTRFPFDPGPTPNGVDDTTSLAADDFPDFRRAKFCTAPDSCLWSDARAFRFSLVQNASSTSLYLSISAEGSTGWLDPQWANGVWEWSIDGSNNQTGGKFVRTTLDQPLFNIARVQKDAASPSPRLIAVAGYKYHPSIPARGTIPAGFQPPGIYRCNPPTSGPTNRCVSWEPLLTVPNYNFPVGPETNIRGAAAGDLIKTAGLGSNANTYYVATFYQEATRAGMAIPLAVSYDGIQWGWDNTPKGFRGAYSMNVLQLGNPSKKVLALGTQAGLYMLEFP